MYTSIEENEELMNSLRRNKDSLEANCYVLKAISNLPYEEQLVIAKGLLFNDTETKRRKNKEEYEANRIRRLEKQRERVNEMILCPYCDISIKSCSLQKHKNNSVCIEKQEELYGPLETTRCNLCELKIRIVELDKHKNNKKCLKRQELLKQLMEDD